MQRRLRDETYDLGVAHLRMPGDDGDDVGERQGVRVLDVHGDLADLLTLRRSQRDPDRSELWQALRSAFSDERSDPLGLREARRRRKLEVEGDKRSARGDERDAGAWMRQRRPEVSAKLFGGELSLESFDPSPPDLRARATAPKHAVEQDGDVKLSAEKVREQKRLRDGRADLSFVKMNDGRDVDRADVRVLTPAVGDIDVADGDLEAGEQRVGENGRRPLERVDAAMVVRVRVKVKELGAMIFEGLADGLDDAAILALRDVGDRKQLCLRALTCCLGTVGCRGTVARCGGLRRGGHDRDFSGRAAGADEGGAIAAASPRGLRQCDTPPAAGEGDARRAEEGVSWLTRQRGGER